MINVYRYGKKWQSKLWHEGKQHCRIRPTKGEALRAAEDLLEELKNESQKDSREAPTFYDYCLETYAPEAKEEELAEATYRNRRYTIRTLVKKFGTLKLDAITDDHVKEYRKERRKEGCLPSTINDDVKVLKRILNHARAQKKFPVAELEIAPLPEPKTKGHVRAWSGPEIGWLFGAIKKHSSDIMAMVVFGLNTGCRKTEIIRLRWESIHWDTRQISIEPNEEWRPKSNKPRTVPLSDTLLPWLRRLQQERENLPVHKRSDFVFVGGRQKRPLKFWPQNRFDRARKAAVSPAVLALHEAKHEGEIQACEDCQQHALKGGPHTMRHTYASHFLAGGGTLFRLGRILGHTNSVVTERYSHMLPGALEDEAGRVSIAPGSSSEDAQ
jgi:integrase